MNLQNEDTAMAPRVGLDLGTFAVKGVLAEGKEIRRVSVPTAGNPALAAKQCLEAILQDKSGHVYFGLTGANAPLLAGRLGIRPLLEIEALQRGLAFQGLKAQAVLSLGHENMYYFELGSAGEVTFFNRNGQCAAGSGAFWYQQATRMGYDDRQLAEIAYEADAPVKISGRCAVFAKSDMTHAINEGATQSAVSAGMAKALADMVLSGVALNRITGPGVLLSVGGVSNNRAVMKYIEEYCNERDIELIVPPDHEFISALGASAGKKQFSVDTLLGLGKLVGGHYTPENPLPPLKPKSVKYMEETFEEKDYDLSAVYLGVDCGSVSTKCALLDAKGHFIGGIYFPTAGRPALQVMELMKEVENRYGDLLRHAPIVACTTGSGRFLSQKILNAEYAVDEITCQAEGVKYLCGDAGTLSIIEIGGEDSKFLELKDGLLYDYNMNPVCAAGTGTFLENLAGLLGVEIKDEFSRLAFEAEYAIDLGDTCTLLSQSSLVAAASQGLPLASQLASLAYSSAKNYITKTVESRALEGRLIFTGATAKNHALAAAFAAECGREIIVPPHPELSGALGSAVIARAFQQEGVEADFSFRSLQKLTGFTVSKSKCKAKCEHEHNCTLDVIAFNDGSKFLYGDRCGRYSGLEKKVIDDRIPDYKVLRNEAFYAAAGEPLGDGLRIGLARSGMFFDLYPFWSAFFRRLGAQIVLSPPTTPGIMEKGKRELKSEMCFPLEVLVGHHAELNEMDLDYLFIPEVVDMEPLLWAREWPRAFTCSLLQTAKGVIANSLHIPDEKILYAQLNYRGGKKRILFQLKPIAQKILGSAFSEELLSQAVEEGYSALGKFRSLVREKSVQIMDELANYKDQVCAVFVGRPYTIYDDFVSKGSLDFARQRGLLAIPQDFLLEYLAGWYSGEVSHPVLDQARDEFEKQLQHLLRHMDNIYAIQLQKMLSTVFFAEFLNERAAETGLPLLHIVFQDPFKCGPNAMLRHFLGSISGYLRLTLDEHTAPAGMITRLEAFKNTCRSKKVKDRPEFYSARTTSVEEGGWRKIYVPDPTHHARVFVAMFRNMGLEAELLPRSKDRDLGYAKRFVNGNECLPLIQNMQDFLDFLHQHQDDAEDGIVFFQGWACGPCRYGLYAPTQSLLINKAGFGEGKICSVKLDDVVKKYGLPFIVGVYDGLVAIDLLYKMLHTTRPYELEEGISDRLFEKHSAKLMDALENNTFRLASFLAGQHLRPLKRCLEEAAREFAAVPRTGEKRPRILVGGEFYVRLDDRCNQDVIRKIEAEGGEASLAPASELFSYTNFINYHEAVAAHRDRKHWQSFIRKTSHGLMNSIAHREEKQLFSATNGLLSGHEEPSPAQIMQHASRYVSEHYGGEPPMTIGRAAALGDRDGVAGIIFVAPFTCMPGSVVEAHVSTLREELNLPIVSIYYDGKENANRDEFIESLVFQAKQRIN
ncbi:MAG TPA: hypothetical protein GXZ24_03270 [Firmicutes bacterium]|nr:hypothetical protein [Bacillota bacterium]